MKTYQKIIILVILLILAILVYISKNKKTENLSIEDEKTSTTTVATSSNIVISDTNEFYDIEAQYPNEPRDKTSMMERDTLAIVNRKKEEWKIGGPLHKEEMNILAQYPDRPIIKYELNIKYDKFESKEKDIVSYVFKNYEFTGGAHGNAGIVTYVYDKDGLIDIKDILNLNNNNDTALIKIIKDKLKISLGEMYNQDMLNAGLKSGVYSFNNFAVQDAGIKFIFGQYEVAPYAAGMPEVLVGWEELEKLLK